MSTVMQLRQQIRRHGTPADQEPALSADDWYEVPSSNVFSAEAGKGGAAVWSSQEWLTAFDTLVSSQVVIASTADARAQAVRVPSALPARYFQNAVNSVPKPVWHPLDRHTV